MLIVAGEPPQQKSVLPRGAAPIPRPGRRCGGRGQLRARGAAAWTPTWPSSVPCRAGGPAAAAGAGPYPTAGPRALAARPARPVGTPPGALAPTCWSRWTRRPSTRCGRWPSASRGPTPATGIGPAGRIVRPARAGRTGRTGCRVRAALRAGRASSSAGHARAAVTGARESLEAAMAPAVLRSRVGGRLWRSAAAAPGLPERVRVALAYRVHLRSCQAGRPRLSGRHHRRRSRPDRRAQEPGRPPDPGGRAPSSTWVTSRSAWPRRSRPSSPSPTSSSPGSGHGRRSRSTRRCGLLFHRVPHFDQLTSPLAERPAEFLAPLRASATAQALAAPRGRRTPAATPPADRPLRLLCHAPTATPTSCRRSSERYAESPAVELRYLHLADDPVAAPLTHTPVGMVEHLVAGQSRVRQPGRGVAPPAPGLGGHPLRGLVRRRRGDDHPGRSG